MHIAEPQITTQYNGPIWGRMPGYGQRLEGLCRGELYTLLKEGSIRTKVLRKPGKERGIRLIHIPSVRAYIESYGVDEKGANGSEE